MTDVHRPPLLREPAETTKWRLCATFDATELEADGVGDALIAFLPLGAEIDLEPIVESA